MRVLIGVFAAWACAWAIVVLHAPDLALVAGLGFLQNLAFTFVSRGRNSGSLGYHMVASVFSNGIWVTMFVIGIKITTAPDADVLPFAFVYCLSTMAGSVFAHWLARKVERGKARNVQEDRVQKIEEDVRELSKEVTGAKMGLIALDEKLQHQIAELTTGECARGAPDLWAGTAKHVDELHQALDAHAKTHGEVDETRRNLEALAREVWGHHADQGLSKTVTALERQLEDAVRDMDKVKEQLGDLARLRHALRTRATIREAVQGTAPRCGLALTEEQAEALNEEFKPTWGGYMKGDVLWIPEAPAPPRTGRSCSVVVNSFDRDLDVAKIAEKLEELRREFDEHDNGHDTAEF
jgi:hypothetical protein